MAGKKENLTDFELKRHITDLDKPIQNVIDYVMTKHNLTYSDIFNFSKETKYVKNRVLLWTHFVSRGFNFFYIEENFEFISIGFNRAMGYRVKKDIDRKRLKTPGYIIPMWEQRLSELKPMPTRDDGLDSQLDDLTIIAEKFGLIKAAKFLEGRKQLIEQYS